MRIKNKTSKNKNSGITLIALVITIVVLLILAGVAIASLTGENGLLERASRAKDETEVAQEKEQLDIATIGSYGQDGTIDLELLAGNLSKIAGLTNESGEGITSSTTITLPYKVKYTGTGNEYTIDGQGNATKVKPMPTVATAPTEPVEENTKYDDGTNKADGTSIAVIPKGFKVINGGDNPKIDDGLVVQDKAGNQWVWIPVADASVMYTHVDEGIAITGGSGKTYVSGVTTNYYSNSGIISGITRGLPNVTSSNYREPDVVVYSDGTRYDAVEANCTAAGFTNLQNMAQSLVADYEEMIASIEKNKGFYVGRYELSGTVASPTEQGNKTPLVSQTWYNLYKACKGFTVEGVVESRMIWGCQWDMVCNYIAEDSTYSITDSSSWGNYENTEVKSSEGNTTIKPSGTSTKLNTGVTTFTMAKNIYDIAGNCWEWTQEACNSGSRDRRGRQLRLRWL